MTTKTPALKSLRSSNSKKSPFLPEKKMKMFSLICDLINTLLRFASLCDSPKLSRFALITLEHAGNEKSVCMPLTSVNHKILLPSLLCRDDVILHRCRTATASGQMTMEIRSLRQAIPVSVTPLMVTIVVVVVLEGLPLAVTLVLPESVKKELEDPESRYNFGWSHGKEKLESGKPVPVWTDFV
ncbi:hypothetical protein ACFE04_023139 [Oxalis oulophora]